ncbi:MAG TPA: 6,7-dimethyl-8-ribityllumazine synthase [Miltoncostaeaceae bacterium]|nr:6,7-dimethyl-8-ribityllumazine synthase [Miltoncostaeaceae bacterium]
MARLTAAPAATPLRRPHVRIAAVCSGFHRDLTQALLDGARARLAECGLAEGHLEDHWVPGAFEAPFAAKALAESGRYAAVIALGAVVRGSTAHFDHVCYAASQGLTRVGLDTGVPCTFGILTCDTLEQAWARAGGEVGNAGADAADAAVALVNLAGAVRT